MIYLTVIIARKDDFKLRKESVKALSVDKDGSRYKFTLTYLNGYDEVIYVFIEDFSNISILTHTSS